MEQYHAPDPSGLYRHVRHLEGTADHKRQVSKIDIIRISLPGEIKSTGICAVIVVAIKHMRIMKSKSSMHHGPGNHHPAENYRNVKRGSQLSAIGDH